MRRIRPLVIVNAVGLTRRILGLMPQTLTRFPLANALPISPVLPAVTMTAQASLLTGRPAGDEIVDGKLRKGHGIVANGWLFRDTMEVRFWQQSNRLLQVEPLYTTLKKIYSDVGEDFRVAKLFWWFNQGADVDLAVTPKPHYGSDGNKVFDIDVVPREVKSAFNDLGSFPFPSFWGPMAGRPSSAWITELTKRVLTQGTSLLPSCSSKRPFDLTLVYLPHLDYDPQRFGPSGCDLSKCASELDDMIAQIVRVADQNSTDVWLVSEYGHVDVDHPVYLNRWLRDRGSLVIRPGPFGEMLDTFESRAFAVVDHQLAHIYVKDPKEVAVLARDLRSLPGVADVAMGPERSRFGLDHARSGEIVVLSEANAWFAYPYWLDDRQAPDFAGSVDIHRKPGFDPCEMFFDQNLLLPKGKAALRLVQKKLGFRTRFDVISLDAGIVRGSHGLIPESQEDFPVLATPGPVSRTSQIRMTDIHGLLLEHLSPKLS